MRSEEKARQNIDRLLAAAGWSVQDIPKADIYAARGVAIRELSLYSGGGIADYPRYLGGKVADLSEAGKQGATLTGVEFQSGRYAVGLPQTLPAWMRPPPFLYKGTGLETHFTNALAPESRARNTFAFHRPETPVACLPSLNLPTPRPSGGYPAGWANSAKCWGVAFDIMVTEDASRSPFGLRRNVLDKAQRRPARLAAGGRTQSRPLGMDPHSVGERPDPRRWPYRAPLLTNPVGPVEQGPALRSALALVRLSG
jgi:hypothetical protein